VFGMLAHEFAHTFGEADENFTIKRAFAREAEVWLSSFTDTILNRPLNRVNALYFSVAAEKLETARPGSSVYPALTFKGHKACFMRPAQGWEPGILRPGDFRSPNERLVLDARRFEVFPRDALGLERTQAPVWYTFNISLDHVL